MLEAFAQTLVFGILVGALYGLIAVGLSLVFGVLKILNIAHGELLMIGGYFTFWLFHLLGIDPFIAILVVVPALLIIGVVLHFVFFRWIVHFEEEVRIKNSLLIAFGLTLVFHNLAILLWTADERVVATTYSSQALELFGLRFPVVRSAGLVIAFVALFGLEWFLRRTYWGKAIRATAEDWRTASLTGIDINLTYLTAFALGSALAGVAGTLVAVGYSVSPSIGLQWTLKALVVVVLAGLGSMTGTFFAGVFLGMAEAVSSFFIGGEYRALVGLVIFILVLLLRPQGFFGSQYE